MTDPASFPPLVVGTDITAVRRAFRPSLVIAGIGLPLTLFGAVAVAALTASTMSVGSTSGFGSGFAIGMLAGSGLLFTSLFFIYTLVRFSSLLAVRVAVKRPLILDANGMSWTADWGELFLPWAAVAGVTVRDGGRRRIVSFLLDPAAHPDAPGVRSDVTPGQWRQIARNGLRLGSVGIDTPIETVLAATAAFSGGRLVAR
ncbi:hypothetical protein [Schumannella soli]|uniref:PH domain-containing protein n=1 Tax=Schumannella soli TaxID=2590779 RepID=A0A506XXS7_9MICO|nr:hypothetical protein [Schumannella soli]TPW74220.1 hypothetical protein FJ657_16485 [Schumannella soli]